MIRRLALFSVLCAVAFGLADAAPREKAINRSRIPLRAYVGATPQQYDTLVCNPGERVMLNSFQFWADDSAMTPTLNVWFVSLNSKTVYAVLTSGAFTANTPKNMQFTSQIGFPRDSTILAYYNIQGATPGTLDTLTTNIVYVSEVGP